MSSGYLSPGCRRTKRSLSQSHAPYWVPGVPLHILSPLCVELYFLVFSFKKGAFWEEKPIKFQHIHLDVGEFKLKFHRAHGLSSALLTVKFTVTSLANK